MKVEKIMIQDRLHGVIAETEAKDKKLKNWWGN